MSRRDMFGPRLSAETAQAAVTSIFLRFEEFLRKAGEMDMFDTLVYKYRLKGNLPVGSIQGFSPIFSELIKKLSQLCLALDTETRNSKLQVSAEISNNLNLGCSVLQNNNCTSLSTTDNTECIVKTPYIEVTEESFCVDTSLRSQHSLLEHSNENANTEEPVADELLNSPVDVRIMGKSKFACTQCSKTFKTKKGLENHGLLSHKVTQNFGETNVVEKRDKTNMRLQHSKSVGIEGSQALKNFDVEAEKPNNCGTSSTKNNELNIHHVDPQSSAEADIQFFCCKECYFVYRTEDEFKNHPCVLRNNNQQLKSTLLIQDQAKLQSLRRFICSLCLEEYRSFLRVCLHLKKCKVGPYFCEICTSDVSFETMKLLNVHKKLKHHGLNNFICNECGSSFKFKNSLSKHKLKVHETNLDSFECEICAETFSKKVLLTNHKTHVHKIQRLFLCQICGCRFCSQSSLTTHISGTHRNGIEYSCKLCNKNFSRKDKWEYHLTIHTREKPFNCEICEKRFAIKSKFLKHQQTHAVKKRVQIKKSADCQQSYKSDIDLDTHTNYHEDEGMAENFMSNKQMPGIKPQDIVLPVLSSLEHSNNLNEVANIVGSLTPESNSILLDFKSQEISNTLLPSFVLNSDVLIHQVIGGSQASDYLTILDTETSNNVMAEQELMDLQYSPISTYLPEPLTPLLDSDQNFDISTSNQEFVELQALSSQLPDMEETNDIQRSLIDTTHNLCLNNFNNFLR